MSYFESRDTGNTKECINKQNLFKMSNQVIKTAKVSAEETIQIADVKGVELSAADMLTLASQIAEAEQSIESACYAYHNGVIDSYVAIGKAVLKLRAIVDSNLANLGNFTSFKSWMADKTFGTRRIGYKQCTLYATIGKNEAVARELYNGSDAYWTLSALASAVNEATGNVKSGGRKATEKPEPAVADADVSVESAVADAVESVGSVGVTSLEAVLAFIAVADAKQIAAIKAALKGK